MTNSLLIFITLLAGVALWAVVLYNQLVLIKNNAAKAWSNIDVLLKQRNEELPKLINVCKEHMQYEKDTLQRVMEARNKIASAMQSSNMTALSAAENQLRLGLGNLFATVEAYPELKASKSFQQLQNRITTLEESIADRREFYNDSATINNVRIEQFPDVVVARMAGFQPFRLMSFSKSEIADVDTKGHFQS